MASFRHGMCTPVLSVLTSDSRPCSSAGATQRGAVGHLPPAASSHACEANNSDSSWPNQGISRDPRAAEAPVQVSLVTDNRRAVSMSSLDARRDETTDTCATPSEPIPRPKDSECCLTRVLQSFLTQALYGVRTSNAQSGQGLFPRNANVRGESVAPRFEGSNPWFINHLRIIHS